ncbi:hypothetical protein [Nocardiopsis sp. FR26]|uniref:hypothetical protein n=1 Tax=Nocardiopsis sp. FR26 TaxID=2605987 RepID=UPI00135986F8|nr:hypothetical protein [Nocardiopsis sp. FR26]
MSGDQLTSGLSYATVLPPPPWELALARATVADRADGADDARMLLDALGLDREAGPRIRLADLGWRPDLDLRRRSDAPAATAPPSEAVLRARALAAQRRHEALVDYFRARGLSGSALRSAVARLEA